MSYKQNNYSFYVFIFGLFIWELSSIINFMSNPNLQLVSILRYFGLGILIISKFLNLNLTIKDRHILVTFILATFFIINNVYFAKDSSFLEVIVLVLCSYGYNLDRIIKDYFWIRVISFSVIILLVLIGIIPNQITVFNSRIRYYMGFGWPSFSSFLLFFVVLYFIWINYNTFSLLWFLLFLVINQYLYKMTDTKTPYYLTIAILLIWLFFTKSRFNFKFNFKWMIFLSLIPILLICLITYLPLNAYKFPNINNILSGRLNYGYIGINTFGIKLFGQPYYESTIPAQYFTIDSGLLRYLLHFGIISTLIMLVLYQRLILKLLKQQNYIRSIVIIFCFLSAFSDPWFLNISFNLFWIVLNELVEDDTATDEIIIKD